MLTRSAIGEPTNRRGGHALLYFETWAGRRVHARNAAVPLGRAERRNCAEAHRRGRAGQPIPNQEHSGGDRSASGMAGAEAAAGTPAQGAPVSKKNQEGER